MTSDLFYHLTDAAWWVCVNHTGNWMDTMECSSVSSSRSVSVWWVRCFVCIYSWIVTISCRILFIFFQLKIVSVWIHYLNYFSVNLVKIAEFHFWPIAIIQSVCFRMVCGICQVVLIFTLIYSHLFAVFLDNFAFPTRFLRVIDAAAKIRLKNLNFSEIPKHCFYSINVHSWLSCRVCREPSVISIGI